MCKSILYGQHKYSLQYMHISLKLNIFNLGIMTLREQHVHADVEGAPITSRGWILGIRSPVKMKLLAILMFFLIHGYRTYYPTTISFNFCLSSLSSTSALNSPPSFSNKRLGLSNSTRRPASSTIFT